MKIHPTYLSNDEVKYFSSINSTRIILDALLCWFLIFGSWFLMNRFPTPWAFIFGIPVIGARFYALLIIGHDGVHRRLFRSRTTNDRFCDLFIFGPVGLIIRLMDRNHLEHHVHLSTPFDPDRYKHASSNKQTKFELFTYALGLMGLFDQIKKFYLKENADGMSTQKKLSPQKTAPNVVDYLILASWQIALIIGLTRFFDWWAYFALWLFPFYAFAFLGDRMRSFCEHSHPKPDHLADEHRLITFVSNPIERFFISPMNMNFHAVHHLWPSIPYYHLPKADAILRQRAGSEIEWRTS